MTDIEAVWRALVRRAAERGCHVLVHSKDGGNACVHVSVKLGGDVQECSGQAPTLGDALLKALIGSSPVQQHD